MRPWSDIEQKLERDIDRQFAEPFIYWPRQRPPNKRSVLDPARASQLLDLVFDERHKTQKAGRSEQPISTLNPWCDLELSLLDCRVEKSDLFIRQSDNRTYEVVDIKPDGQGRAKLQFRYVGRYASCEEIS